MKTFTSSSRWQGAFGRWLPLLLWMAVIFIMSHQPSDNIPAFGFWDLLVKKGGHFLGYAVLSLLAYRVTIGARRPFLWAFLITALYAISDEFHQTLVDGRNGKLLDVLIDCAGAAASLYLIRQGGSIEKPVKKGVREKKEYRHEN
ncbi:MAG TPA: VanZ family protein [Anaerolineae bacterium]